ncbi:MAG TPA: preprotein translocase subunit YajC [Pseudonocardiaceae bacterium]|jgi:preprotein translocase subunit YajC
MDQLFLPLLLLLLFVPLLMSFRRQRRQVSQMQQLQSSLNVDDDVMTTSGMKATIVAITDDTVDLEIAPGVVTTWLRQAIRERLTDPSLDTQPDTRPYPDEATDEYTVEVRTDEADRR